MAAGNHGEALLRVADELCAELPHAGAEEISEVRSAVGGEGAMTGNLGAADESLVRGLRRALVKIATALGASPDDPHTQRVRVAIDGAEMAIRGELLGGNAEHLPRLLPSFVFMVALPIVEQDRALELSRRTVELIDQEIGPQQ